MTLDLTGKTILLVDDEKFSRTTVARLLEEMGRPDIIFAGDGVEAMDALTSSEKAIDLIISDFNMPGKHGLDFLKAVRSGERGLKRATPFAMLTGYGDKHLVDLALALDVNAFLIKPVSKEALEARLGKMLVLGRTDDWLKIVTDYVEIDVKTALEDIVGIRRPALDKNRLRGIFVMKRDKPLFRDPEMPDDVVEDAAPKTDDPEEPAAGPAKAPAAADSNDGAPGGGEDRVEFDGYECPLDEVPEDAVLARGVFTADGRLFMNAGGQLSARVISILHDLQALGHPVDSIWLQKTTKPQA